MKQYREIARRLSNTTNASMKDNKTFNEWRCGDISDEQCLQEFKNNNGIKDDVIQLNMFVDWLKSLGWKRYKK